MSTRSGKSDTDDRADRGSVNDTSDSELEHKTAIAIAATTVDAVDSGVGFEIAKAAGAGAGGAAGGPVTGPVRPWYDGKRSAAAATTSGVKGTAGFSDEAVVSIVNTMRSAYRDGFDAAAADPRPRAPPTVRVVTDRGAGVRTKMEEAAATGIRALVGFATGVRDLVNDAPTPAVRAALISHNLAVMHGGLMAGAETTIDRIAELAGNAGGTGDPWSDHLRSAVDMARAHLARHRAVMRAFWRDVGAWIADRTYGSPLARRCADSWARATGPLVAPRVPLPLTPPAAAEGGPAFAADKLRDVWQIGALVAMLTDEVERLALRVPDPAARFPRVVGLFRSALLVAAPMGASLEVAIDRHDGKEYVGFAESVQIALQMLETLEDHLAAPLMAADATPMGRMVEAIHDRGAARMVNAAEAAAAAAAAASSRSVAPTAAAGGPMVASETSGAASVVPTAPRTVPSS